MIKINIKETAIRNGIKSGYQLQKAMNIQPAQAYKWFNNDLKMIDVTSLDKLCEFFDCVPSDLIVYKSSKVRKEKPVKSPVNAEKETIKDESKGDLLSTAEVAKRLGLSERTIRDSYKNGRLPFTKIGTKNFVSESNFEAFKMQRLSDEQKQ
jgi:excisionase family DNA binding protein